MFVWKRMLWVPGSAAPAATRRPAACACPPTRLPAWGPHRLGRDLSPAALFLPTQPRMPASAPPSLQPSLGLHSKSSSSLASMREALAEQSSSAAAGAAAAAPQAAEEGRAQRGAGPVAGWPTLSSATQPAATPLEPVAEAHEAGSGPGKAARDGAPAASEERGRGRGAAKALLERLSAEPGSGASGGGGLPPLPEAAPAAHAADAPAPAGAAGAAGETAPRMAKRVSFAGTAPAAAEPAGSNGSAVAGAGAAASGAGPSALDLGPAMQPERQQQQQGQTLASLTAAAVAAGGGGGGAGPSGAVVDPKDLEQLMRRMRFRSNKGLGPGERAAAGRRPGVDRRLWAARSVARRTPPALAQQRNGDGVLGACGLLLSSPARLVLRVPRPSTAPLWPRRRGAERGPAPAGLRPAALGGGHLDAATGPRLRWPGACHALQRACSGPLPL